LRIRKKRLKARIVSYSEIEERFKEILIELERCPLDEEFILNKGAQLVFALNVCLRQMKSANSTYYPEKSEHMAALENASTSITYKFNTCTVEEISTQATAAYKAFGVQ